MSSVTWRNVAGWVACDWRPAHRNGSPIFTSTFLPGRGHMDPIGCTAAVPNVQTGTTGAPVCKASRATPVWPLWSRPSADLVPSG